MPALGSARPTFRFALLAAVLGALLAPGWPLTPAGAAPPGPTCAAPVLDAPQPAADAVPHLSAAAQDRVARLNGLTVPGLRDAADPGRHGDHTLWLDRCGRTLYAEQTAPTADGLLSGLTGTTSSSPTTGPAAPLSDTFDLSSDPSASRTIYLDFDGATISGSAWNDPAYGSAAADGFTVPAYTADGDAAFSAAELAQIQRAWMVVAEDYAPYAVNVTTHDPGADALRRSSSADTRYGVRVVVTAQGPIYDYCHCGGLSYVGVYGDPELTAYQQSWVFTAGVGTDGVTLAQAVSHEVGHTLGLSHDGTSTEPYYTGTRLWAPIMGASYYSPVTQWSRGDYPGANNHEDDTAVIGRVLGVRPDDRADGLDGAEALPAGTSTQRDGVIGTRRDVDAFALTTGAATTISVQPTGLQPDVDLSLTITDAGTGRVVAAVDPAAGVGTSGAATGLGADYRLPAGPVRTYLIAVDGVGNGDPSVAGHYDDYGSEGAYRLTITSGSQPLKVATALASVTATVGRSWDAAVGGALEATGGVAPYTWSATGLPAGAVLGRTTGALRGTVTTPGTWDTRITVTDARGTTARAEATFAAVRPQAASSGPVAGHAAPPAPQWRKVAVRRATVRRPYRDTLTVAGGAGTLRWTVLGTLPPGIRLRVADAGRRLVVVGRAHRDGRWRVRLVGRDALGRTLARRVRLTVRH